jgi:Major intrinsic protein
MSSIAYYNTDGCSINPARSFGPALVANQWVSRLAINLFMYYICRICCLHLELIISEYAELLQPCKRNTRSLCFSLLGAMLPVSTAARARSAPL